MLYPYITVHQCPRGLTHTCEAQCSQQSTVIFSPHLIIYISVLYLGGQIVITEMYNQQKITSLCYTSPYIATFYCNIKYCTILYCTVYFSRPTGFARGCSTNTFLLLSTAKIFINNKWFFISVNIFGGVRLVFCPTPCPCLLEPPPSSGLVVQHPFLRELYWPSAKGKKYIIRFLIW